MTDKQPEALRLADLLDYAVGIEGYVRDEAATELRRLHEVNAELVEALQFALDVLAAQDEIDQVLGAAIVTAEAAIAKATGEQQ
jgi:hypothetical protein